jgi:hypothetical protein
LPASISKVGGFPPLYTALRSLSPASLNVIFAPATITVPSLPLLSAYRPLSSSVEFRPGRGELKKRHAYFPVGAVSACPSAGAGRQATSRASLQVRDKIETLCKGLILIFQKRRKPNMRENLLYCR